MNKKIFIVCAYLFIPTTLFAAEFFSSAKNFLTIFGGIINSLIAITATLALVFFFWGLAQFILKSGDPASHEEGRNKMVWGTIALFIIFSIWGIVGFIQGELFGGNPDSRFPPGFDDVPLGDEPTV